MLRILGPLEVAGEPVPGGPKERALLALLVLHAGEVVPRDRIVEELWSGAAPETARHAVQVYVSRLRKLVTIAASAGGYRLDAAEVDAHAFERLVAQARAAGDPATAAGLLRRALSLWRGPALADVRYERFAQGEIARLEELRLAACEERFAAELDLGRHGELVPELEALVAAEPLRERLRAQHMLALYRCGRQADALAAYRQGARLLREELGLEPGAELRELEAAILRHDVPPGGGRVSLPAPVTPLVGRASDVEEAGGLLRGAARLLTLTGPGGIGKTRLALAVAADVADAFPDGVHFVGLAPVEDASLVGSAIASALAAEGEPAQQLGARRVLLLLDNFEHLVEAAPLVTKLLRECPGLRVLTTSRSPLDVYGEQVYPVPALDGPEAVELFTARARGVWRAFSATPTVAAICERLDGLPLAIELAAARTRTLALEEMLDALPLALASAGPRDLPSRQRTLRTAIAWSHDLLDPAQAAAFRRLGSFAGGWDAAAARAVGADPEAVEVLVAQSLVMHGVGRRHMLATIREFALERLAASGEGDDVRRSHARHFLEVADRADRELREGGDQTAVLDALDREHDNLRVALAWAAAREPELTLRLAGALASFWAVRGHAAEGRRRLGTAIAGAGGLDGPADARALAKAAAGAGVLARGTDPAEARPLLQCAARLYGELQDFSGAVRALTNLGFVELLTGERARARASYEQALEAAGRSGNPRDRAMTLNCLADLALRDGEPARADELSVEGLALAREAGDQEGVACCAMNRAYAALGRDRLPAALEWAREALAAWTPLKDLEGVARCLDAVAVAIGGARPHEAAQLLGAADELRASAGATLDAFERALRDRAGAQIAAPVLAAGLERGRAMSLEQAVAAAGQPRGR